MTSNYQTFSIRGYSLAEVMTAVGIIASIVGLSLPVLERMNERSEIQKLEQDVGSLNRAAQVYLANGGAFETSTDVDSMLAKLKTYPLSTQRQTIVGLRGPMVDMRVTAVPMTTEEQASNRPRAVWNSDTERLALVTSGPGVKEFILGTVPPIIEEVRESTVEYASVSDWIWDHGSDGQNDRPGYGGDVSTSDETPLTSLGGGGGGGNGSFTPGDYRQTLAPPVFSLPGGFYEYVNFPLTLTLTDPNPEGASQILYSINGSGWELYDGDLIIPGDYATVVQAYCSSADPDFWNDSGVAEEIYETLYISGSSDGEFESPNGDSNLVYAITDTENGSIFEWGTPASGYTQPSSLEFEGTEFENISPEQSFEIGTLTFYNGTIVSGTGANGVELELDLDLTVNIPIATQEITFTFELINTPNYSYQTNDENADYVYISAPREEFTTTFNGITYYIDISFGEIGQNGFSTVDEFHVWENHSASGSVMAKITTEEPDEWDTVPPAVLLFTNDDAVNGQFEVFANFSELVNGFDLADIQVTNGAKGSLSGNGIDYSFFVTPTSDGLITISVPSGSVVDGNENENTASNLVEVIADMTPPEVEVSYSAGQGGYGGSVNEGTQNDPYQIPGPVTIDLEFDEPVAGLSYDDFLVEGATLSQLAGSGANYSVFFSPTSGAGLSTLKLTTGAVVDGVGNGSIASSTAYFAIDQTSPSVVLATASLAVEGSFEVDVEVSEPVSGFDATDVVSTNSLVSDFADYGDGRNYSFRVTPQSAGSVTVSVPTAAFADAALNTNTASNILEVAYTATSYIDFADYTIESYGGWQDQGDYSVQDSGATLYVRNNAWKSIDHDVTVTADTVLEFEFWSNRRGEVHGIGLDSDDMLSSSLTFKVYGTQNWGIQSYDNYSSGDGWKSYSIPVGQFYTGEFDRIVFVADHDRHPRNARSKFRNVRIYTP